MESKLDEFDKRGVAVLAVSSDTKERAAQTREAWGLALLRIGYGLDLAAARNWGLFISSGRGMTSAGIGEPERFSEPALYLIRPDGTLYFGSVQTMPFARPHFADILAAIDYVVKNNYPARGEVRDLKNADQRSRRSAHLPSRFPLAPVDGNHYFPPDSLAMEHFRESDTKSVCPWKGVARYYTIVVGDQKNVDAA